MPDPTIGPPPDSPMVTLAKAALIDAGHPALCAYVRDYGDGRPTVRSPCPAPHTVIQAVALAHRASGHAVTIYRLTLGEDEGSAAGFDCVDCGFESDLREDVRCLVL